MAVTWLRSVSLKPRTSLFLLLLGCKIVQPKLEIGTGNPTCLNSLGLFIDYSLVHISFRDKTFLFFKIES